MIAIKLITCNQHALKVIYLAGLHCPVCHPEYYTPIQEAEIALPEVLWFIPHLHPVSHRQDDDPCPTQGSGPLY